MWMSMHYSGMGQPQTAPLLPNLLLSLRRPVAGELAMEKRIPPQLMHKPAARSMMGLMAVMMVWTRVVEVDLPPNRAIIRAVKEEASNIRPTICWVRWTMYWVAAVVVRM